MAAPVTKSEAALARKTAMPAMSSIVPQRWAGVRRSTFSLRPGTSRLAAAVRSVSIQPGSTALTWMLSAAHAVAIDFVSCTMPPFERSEEHTSELQSQSNLVCRLLLEKKKYRERDKSH